MPKIMVVDDEVGIRFILRKTLERAGYDVVEADNGEECLNMFGEVGPDLVFMDVMMPGMDGWEACKTIKETRQWKNIPVSMLSVKAEAEDIKKSLEYARADAHLTKPMDMKEIVETAEKLLGSI